MDAENRPQNRPGNRQKDPRSSPRGKRQRSSTRISKQPDQLLTVADTAIILNCDEKTVRRRIKAKKLRAIKDDGILRIEPVDLQDYIRDHRSH
jgi:hypothetical protein